MPKGIYVHKSLTEETKRKLSDSLKGRTSGPKSEETKRKMSKPKSDETKAKISASMKIAQNRPEAKAKNSASKSGENNYGWKGGLGGYYHKKAKELFGTPYCEECGRSLEEYMKTHKLRFPMHCISGERKEDYSILEQWNWRCLCASCHAKYHKWGRRRMRCQTY